MENQIQYNSRRNFLKKAATICGIALVTPAVVPLLQSCNQNSTSPSGGSSAQFNVNDHPALKNIGGFEKIQFTGKNGGLPVLAIRASQSSFTTFTTRCSHQGCEVGLPSGPNNDIVCPCHGSTYSFNDGHVLRGPSDGTSISSLKKLDNTFDQSTNIVTVNF